MHESLKIIWKYALGSFSEVSQLPISDHQETNMVYQIFEIQNTLLCYYFPEFPFHRIFPFYVSHCRKRNPNFFASEKKGKNWIYGWFFTTLA